MKKEVKITTVKDNCCKVVAGAYTPDEVPDWEERVKPDGDLEIAWTILASPRYYMDETDAVTEAHRLKHYVTAKEIMPEVVKGIGDGYMLLFCVRPKSVNAKKEYNIKLLDPESERPCVHLGESGCKLSCHTRPYGCKVEFNGNGDCRLTDARVKLSIFKEWLPHYDKLLDIVYLQLIEDTKETTKFGIEEIIMTTEHKALKEKASRTRKKVCIGDKSMDSEFALLFNSIGYSVRDGVDAYLALLEHQN